VSEAGEFVDATLQREASWPPPIPDPEQSASGMRFYGASVGAVRGTIRDALRRHAHLAHDDVTALSSELWSVPVFERRLAAIVLLQSSLELLDNSDLTRIEGFLRTARLRALVDPLAIEVIGPLVHGLAGLSRGRAEAALDRWAGDPDAWLRRAAVLAPLRALRSGTVDPAAIERRMSTAATAATPPPTGLAKQSSPTGPAKQSTQSTQSTQSPPSPPSPGDIVLEAIELVHAAIA
jgi:hypothetical protein